MSVNLVLIATGWALYYLGSESVRPFLSAVHWGIGIILPFGLLWHARAGLRPRLLPVRRRVADPSAGDGPAPCASAAPVRLAQAGAPSSARTHPSS